MCYACEPRLTALEMPKVHARPEPTGPQYFTFDPLPEVEVSPAHRKVSKTNRIKRRSRRVLYPPVAKRYFPTEEPSYAKRLLFLLLTIVLFQIYNAEEEPTTTMVPSLSPEENISACFWEVKEPHREPFLLEEALSAAPSLDTVDGANATSWYWVEEETTSTTSDSAIYIAQFWEQSPAAF